MKQKLAFLAFITGMLIATSMGYARCDAHVPHQCTMSGLCSGVVGRSADVPCVNQSFVSSDEGLIIKWDGHQDFDLDLPVLVKSKLRQSLMDFKLT